MKAVRKEEGNRKAKNSHRKIHASLVFCAIDLGCRLSGRDGQKARAAREVGKALSHELELEESAVLGSTLNALVLEKVGSGVEAEKSW
jgi:hypothetical protein